MNPERRAAIMETLSLLAGLLLMASPSDRMLIQHNMPSLKLAFSEMFKEGEGVDASK